MADDYRTMWAELGLDLERHDQFLAPVPGLFGDLFLAQENRPLAMAYFDGLMGEIHGGRVKELVDFKRDGGLVVGTFCVFVPDELVLAAGGAAVGLCAGAQYPVEAAERILPRNTCPLVKASLGFRLTRICPYMQVSNFLVGETTCDGKKKTWEIFNDYTPVHVMELPQRKDEADRRLWLAEIERLAARLEEESGVTITTTALKEAIDKVNGKRRALKRLYQLRRNRPVPISGKDALLVTQLAFFDDPVRFSEKTNALCDELEQRVAAGRGVAPAGAPRILVSGTPQALPNWKLHHLIESAGGIVVCEETCTGTRYFEQEVDGKAVGREEQLAALAERALHINCACYTPNPGRIEDILRLAREWQVDGVVYYSLQFCQTYGIEYYTVEQALKEAGIPVIKVETDYSGEDTQQLATRIQAFLEMVG